MSDPPGELLDDFRDVSGWRAVASGQTVLTLARDAGPHGHALRLDFDFKGGGGFAVARRELSRALPESFAIHGWIRGAAPANRFELKLVDPSDRNVWWYRRDAFSFPRDWQALEIRSREIEFAWGPAGGGAPRELGALEIAIAAGPGGAGSVWIADLRLLDLEPRAPTRVRASSALPRHAPEHALDGNPETSWRSGPAAGPQWIELDFGAAREVGGLVIDWAPDGAARAFDVQTSLDASVWIPAWSARQAEGRRSYVYLPDCTTRFLRLALLESAGDGFGIAALGVRPHSFSSSLSEFLHAVASEEARGLYPRWLLREQSLWTPVGVSGADAPALLNEEGLLEVDRGSFSLEPFLLADGALVTWADAEVSQALEEGFLPIPSSRWRARGLVLTTTAFASGEPARPVLQVRYRLENPGAAARHVSLFAALRPYQVTPPWQAHGKLGGSSPIHALRWHAGAVWVNENKAVIPLAPPTGFGAAAFEQGSIIAHLALGALPLRTQVRDDFGLASGALRWDFEMAPGAASEVFLAVPFGVQEPERLDAQACRARAGPAALEAVASEWRDVLGCVRLSVPEPALACIDALRTAAAHILLNRDGPALQPGPRRYTRSWIRDAATMSAALLRMGHSDAVRDFLRWYAPHQSAAGNVPMCVDRSGPDWLPEHDSHGQLVYTIAEHFRFTGDRAFLAEMWPAVARAVDYIERLRAPSLAPEFLRDGLRAFHGILPESVSHEGYLAHPVHSYWDDFWALRGLADAAELAHAQGEEAHAARIATMRDELRACLYASVRATIADRRLRYVPGSVEWADFDPAATATALATTDAERGLPADALAFTFDEYVAGLRRRRDAAIDWSRYSAYEIRILAALVRLGRRDEAHELIDFFLADRRPRAWNQWPEISWRDPRSPGHVGDVPHAWIGAEWVLAMLSLFAYEDPAQRVLILCAGIPAHWLADGAEIVVAGLPTYWGSLDYTLSRRSDNALLFALAPGLEAPPGGIVVRPPLAGPLVRVTIDGEPAARFDAASVTLDGRPASVVLEV